MAKAEAAPYPRATILRKVNEHLLIAGLRAQEAAEAALRNSADMRDANRALIDAGLRAEQLAEAAVWTAKLLRETNARLLTSGALADERATSAEASVKERDDLLTAISHDLKSPLTAVRIRVGVLCERADLLGLPESREIAAGLRKIELATERMAQMLNDLVDAASLRAAEALTLIRRTTNLGALARQIAVEHQQLAAHPHIRIEADDAVVGEWDTFRLERVLDNLLSNAIKFSPGGGEVLVTVDREQDGLGSWAVLVVRDQGIGVPAAELPRLFDRFRRGSGVAGIAGSGIGLWGVRRIVEQHGGTIEIASTEGIGTDATVRLPLGTNPEFASP